MTAASAGAGTGHTVLVGTFNEPGDGAAVLAHGGGLVRTAGWPGSPEVTAGSGPDAPSWLVRGRAGTPAAGHLYAALHLPEGRVAVLDLSEHDVGWVTSQLVPTGGSDTCHLDLNPAGTWLAAASYTSGTLTVAPVLADGRLGEPVVVAAPEGSGPVAPRQDAPHLHFVMFLDDDRLLVTDLGADRILEYSIAALTGGGEVSGGDEGVGDRAPSAGRPTAVHQLPAGTGPRHLAVLPPRPETGIAGPHLAVVGELDSRLHLLDPAAGPEGFAEVAVVPTHGPDADPETARDNLPSHLVVSEGGALVYVANRGRDTIGVIRRSDTPELVAEVPCGGSWPRHIALGTANGAPVLYVALERDDAVVVLPLDADGIPGDAGTRVTVWRPGFVLPD